MFRQLIQSKKMDDSDDSDGDVFDEYEDDRLEDEHYKREADRQYRQTEYRRKIAAENRLQIAAADRYQRLVKQLLSLKALIDGDNGVKKNETLRDYINSIVMDAYADGGALNGWDADTSSEESPLFQELAKSKLFQQLEKIQSILKEYFSGPATPHESRGLRKFMNKSPCTTSTEESATKKWDFACTRKGGISPEYVSKYIKLVFKFYHFLDNYYQTVN